MAVWSTTNVREITESKRIDSEFFHPKYLIAEALVNSLEDVIPLGQIGKFKIGPFGSAFHVKNYDNASEYRYIRGKDVKPFQLLNNDNVYMPEKDFIRLSQYAVQKDDLLISVVGTLGNVAIVPADIKGIFSCKSTIFRESKILPTYLLAYFNSKYGKECLLRRQRGAVQTGLNKEDLKTVPVPVFNNEIQQQIGEKVSNAINLDYTSQTLYQQATTLLEKELGLDKITFEKPKSYTASFSEVASTRRMNAEYFSPLVKSILSQPFLTNAKPIASFFHIIRGSSPKGYLTSGVPVIKTKNIRLPEIDRERIADYVASTKDLTSIQENDLLLASMGVGSLGRMSFIQTLEQDYVVDGTIRVLRKKFETPDNYEIPTMLFLSTKVGQELIYRGIVGSTGIISLPDDYLYKIPIPQFGTELCSKLTQLVKDSITAKKESKQLLEQAKNRVEELIEEAAKSN